ncbi:hypothetical protein ACP70R_020313 [Stipagrostis hirtigluma subsp. patula]
MPNLENLTIHSHRELHSKFLYLKHLIIHLSENGTPSSPAYDYFSLASFLGAAPLETFGLNVYQVYMRDVAYLDFCRSH